MDRKNPSNNEMDHERSFSGPTEDKISLHDQIERSSKIADGKRSAKDPMVDHQTPTGAADEGRLRRWRFVVFGASLLIFATLGGLHYTTGIFYVSMLEYFQESYSATAWIGSVTSAFFLLGGPLSHGFIQIYDCRRATLLGSMIMATGYVISTFASSLSIVLLGYGVVVSIGMCFCYTSSVVALSEYFDKRHGIVTSYAMAGNGIGLFGMSYFLELLISAYGWRLTFVGCAAISLQLLVLGCLFFPIKEKQTKNERIRFTNDPETPDGIKPAAEFQKLQPIEEVTSPTRPTLIEMRESSPMLNDLPDREDFCNPSQRPVPYGSTEDSSGKSTASPGKRTGPVLLSKSSTLEGGDKEDRVHEGEIMNSLPHEENVTGVNCCSIKKMGRKLCLEFIRREQSSVFRDPKFWLVNFATAFIQGATLTIYVIYKDFFMSRGLEESYSVGLSLIGVGDLVGRLLTGVLSNFKWLSPTVFYGSSMFATSFCLLLFLTPPSTAFYLLLSTSFGILYGIQNVYLAVIPGTVFGMENLALVLGQNFFWGGVGALFGAPVAGMVLDSTQNYDAVMYLTAATCSVGGILIFIVRGINRR